MKGNIKVVGTNKGMNRLAKLSGEAQITHKFHQLYLIKFQNEVFNAEINKFIIGDDCMEFEAWIGGEDKNYGKIAFQFTPN